MRASSASSARSGRGWARANAGGTPLPSRGTRAQQLREEAAGRRDTLEAEGGGGGAMQLCKKRKARRWVQCLGGARGARESCADDTVYSCARVSGVRGSLLRLGSGRRRRSWKKRRRSRPQRFTCPCNGSCVGETVAGTETAAARQANAGPALGSR